MDGETLPFVQYLVSLAVVKAVEAIDDDADGASGRNGLVGIKWPNDIYAQHVKIGGILCQSDYCNGKFSVTTGALLLERA